jgi:hypothetical protein
MEFSWPPKRDGLTPSGGGLNAWQGLDHDSDCAQERNLMRVRRAAAGAFNPKASLSAVAYAGTSASTRSGLPERQLS